MLAPLTLFLTEYRLSIELKISNYKCRESRFAERPLQAMMHFTADLTAGFSCLLAFAKVLTLVSLMTGNVACNTYDRNNEGLTAFPLDIGEDITNVYLYNN